MKRNFTLLLVVLVNAMSAFAQDSTAQVQEAPKKSSNLSKFGKGFTFVAPDSSMSTTFHLRTQVLGSTEGDLNGGNWQTDMLIRRWRLKFGGFAYSPKLRYKIELGLSNRDIGASKEEEFNGKSSRIILDAVIKYKFQKHWDLWVGQTKLPGNRERVVSSANLELVDRSIINSNFNIDRDMGVQLRGKYNFGGMLITPKFAFSTGEGRNITAQKAISDASGFGYTAHVDIMPFGAFSKKGDFIQADLAREGTPKLAIGLTYDYNDRAVRQGGQLGKFIYNQHGDLVGRSLTTTFIDAVFKYQGLSITGEYANKTQAAPEVNAEGAEVDTLSSNFKTGSGFTLQAGYLFKNNIQPVVRYSHIEADGENSGITDMDEYTIGLSKYIVGHALKIQGDCSWIDYGSDAKEDKLRFRLQLEVQL